jgi:hypothetical protein
MNQNKLRKKIIKMNDLFKTKNTYHYDDKKESNKEEIPFVPQIEYVQPTHNSDEYCCPSCFQNGVRSEVTITQKVSSSPLSYYFICKHCKAEGFHGDTSNKTFVQEKPRYMTS